ncbi:MAG: serine/threonine-protein kinase, partial [Armatimonadota bacterium]
MLTPNLLELARRERELLESWLVQLDQGWQTEALASWVADRLPGPENPLRRVALAEMVKIDLERQWQVGNQLTLGSYLERYPELGTPQTVAADLIFAEYQVRQQFGASAELSEFARRYPHQAGDLLKLVQKSDAAQSTVPLSFEPPPAVASDTSGTAASDTSPPVPLASTELPETFGRYRILKKLGQGGMGSAYLAHDTQLDRQVAIKVPHFSAQEDPQVVERFLREARAAATIQHPNLCPVYDAGQIDGIHYMTMGYIEGHSLSEFVRPGKPVDERKAAAVVCKLALALQEAHARGIIHRDLKPANVIVNVRGEPVVMDFGLARRTKSAEVALTQTGALMGTPAYMSPEQARGQIKAIGPCTDIYGLGVILYELLAGHRPFRGEVLEVLGQIIGTEPERPSTHRSALDPQLEAICLKAMAKRPEERYVTMAALATALSDWLKAAKQADAGSHSEISVAGLGPARADVHQTPGAGDAGQNPVSVVSSVSAKSASALHLPHVLQPAALRRVSRWLWIASGLAAAAVIFGIILLVRTGQGLVKIELNDPQAQVVVKVDGDTIDVQGLGQFLRLQPGKHHILVTGDGFQTVSESFTVKRGEEEPLRITLVPKAAGVPSESEPPLAAAPT